MSQPNGHSHANGSTNANGARKASGNETKPKKSLADQLVEINLNMKMAKRYNTFHEANDPSSRYAKFHGDDLIGDTRRATGKLADWENTWTDVKRVFVPQNLTSIATVAGKLATGGGLDVKSGAKLIGSLANDSNARESFVKSQVKDKYERMLHPPLTYLGDAFQYRTSDGKFNSVLHPHLGQAGAPYAKTVPSKTHPIGALPDPGDIFDRLMARDEGGRVSQSGLSSMLIYHATIIIHDIFRTNDKDKNISDSSSYLDLSPLYGYTDDMQRKVRDSKYKLGLLKPDTFAEDRLLRQPPGVCVMLVMYNRYHNYAATQLRRINENGRFRVPAKYGKTKLVSVAEAIVSKEEQKQETFKNACNKYELFWKQWYAREPVVLEPGEERPEGEPEWEQPNDETTKEYNRYRKKLEDYIEDATKTAGEQAVEAAKKAGKPIDEKKESEAAQAAFKKSKEDFESGYDAAWKKLDDDLFNTARLITCGIYIQISIHDYLRALMGFHQFNTNFTLDPRLDIDHKNVSRGLGNQVTVEFNLLYRFHCAISLKDEQYTEDFMREAFAESFKIPGFTKRWDPTIEKPDEFDPMDPEQLNLKNLTTQQFLMLAGPLNQPNKAPYYQRTFGFKDKKSKLSFQRNKATGLFDDQQLTDVLIAAMDDPISNFGPRNIPRSLKAVEILGILQARKWEIGTLNDFRDFFGMKRHNTFESISQNVHIQNALRDLYEHPDKVELYPGIFCESNANMGDDPGPTGVDSALWAAIFSDAITLVRSDRFYTVDWNTNSLTSWGMKEVTPDNNNLKSSVFHRLIQRAFPEWFQYDTIRFFHPFYTSQTNAKYAEEQGYGPDFQYNTKEKSAANPKKPKKPVYLVDRDDIRTVLLDYKDFVHPAFYGHNLQLNFPPKIASFLGGAVMKPPKQRKDKQTPLVYEDDEKQMEYFVKLTKEIVQREAITMNSSTYQIDVTRDLAIPVVTRSVADFLGFGHLVLHEENPKGLYSENALYQHITNCQTFLSYNADETKLLKRRKAFKTSYEFLLGLTKGGHIREAGRWISMFARKRADGLQELGYQVAKSILEDEGDSEIAAAMFLFVGLHTAYNIVLSFTTVLDKLIEDLYTTFEKGKNTCVWLTIQELALRDTAEADVDIKKHLMKVQRASVQLPIVRKAVNNRQDLKISASDVIICDIYAANNPAGEPKAIGTQDIHTGANFAEGHELAYEGSFTESFTHSYHPKHVAALSLTAMIKVVAQMRFVRRGHDKQGFVKRVKLDSSNEGYSNFMANMRINEVKYKIKELKKWNPNDPDAAVYDENILKPETTSFMTAEWDEMIPFPTTWKIRFDGFGVSKLETYQAKVNVQTKLPDDFPPFYQPQGASHVGGSFATVVCVCNLPGKHCLCKDPGQATTTKPDAPKTKPTPDPTVEPAMYKTFNGCGSFS